MGLEGFEESNSQSVEAQLINSEDTEGSVEERLANEVIAASNYDELVEVLPTFDGAMDEDGKAIPVHEYADRIKRIMEGYEPLNVLTRKYNLRGKVAELMRQGETPLSEKTPENIIADTNTLEELYSVVESIDSFEGSGGNKYSGEEIVELIKNVIDGKELPNMITRNYGLRAKVRELLDVGIEIDKEGGVNSEELKLKLKEHLEDYDAMVEDLNDRLQSIRSMRQTNVILEYPKAIQMAEDEWRMVNEQRVTLGENILEILEKLPEEEKEEILN